MPTTTIRIDRSVHERLLALSQRTGRQLMDVVGDATEALERAAFAADVAARLDVLRADREAWAEYVGESELAVHDGIA